MKLEDTKRHVVEVVVNCPLIIDFSEYGLSGTDIKREALIKDIMANFDVVETGFLQGDDKNITIATDLISVEFIQGLPEVRGYRVIDIWKEACKKFKAHEVKSLARVIEKTITKLTENKEQKVSEEKKEGFQVWGQQTIYEGQERFVHFMGTEHLTQSVIQFDSESTRFSQECSMIWNSMVSLVKGESGDPVNTKATIKSIIHRSLDQEKICRNILIMPHDWDKFEKADPRKRGMIIDDLLDEAIAQPAPQVSTQPKEEVKEDKGMGKYLDIIKEVHPDLWADLVHRQAKGEVLNEDIINKEIMKVAMVKMFGINPALLESMVKKESRKPEQENFSSENIVRGFDFPFLSEAKCEDPACPVHGEGLHEHQQRVVDLIIGIDPALEGRISFLNVDPNLGKQRQQRPFDFSGMIKFLTNHFEPKPTATEIETTSNVVINQKFIINDVNGNFFCEYKMVWTPTHTRFMYSHTKPDGKQPRAFRQIAEAGGQMTQDEAFRKFQSMRRVALENPHQSKRNPLHGR
jgi:hypothetical protein